MATFALIHGAGGVGWYWHLVQAELVNGATTPWLRISHVTTTQQGSRQPRTIAVGSGERIVRANGVDLCVETFGDPADPALLLIGGASASMDYWDDELCGRLAAGPRFETWYDFRDTGRSVSYPARAPPGRVVVGAQVQRAAGTVVVELGARPDVCGTSRCCWPAASTPARSASGTYCRSRCWSPCGPLHPGSRSAASRRAPSGPAGCG